MKEVIDSQKLLMENSKGFLDEKEFNSNAAEMSEEEIAAVAEIYNNAKRSSNIAKELQSLVNKFKFDEDSIV